MTGWSAGAVIEGPEGVLLVQNRRRNGSHDWSPPGGVIDEGETVLDGLAREVIEETGLVVVEWEGPIYDIEVVAPELGWRLRVESFRAVSYTGELVVDDPDGIVVDARFVHRPTCARATSAARTRGSASRSSEWLAEPWQGLRSFGYDVAGADLASLSVTRR